MSTGWHQALQRTNTAVQRILQTALSRSEMHNGYLRKDRRSKKIFDPMSIPPLTRVAHFIETANEGFIS